MKLFRIYSLSFSIISLLILQIQSSSAQDRSGVLQILIDNSGSMSCEVESKKCEIEDILAVKDFGKTRIESAKGSLYNWAFNVYKSRKIRPNKVRVIELTGPEKIKENEKYTFEELCRANPLSVWNLDDKSRDILLSEITNKIQRTTFGTTPITVGLQNAIEFYKENKQDGNLKIVIISDAGSNCDRSESRSSDFNRKLKDTRAKLKETPTPCEYINEQMKNGWLKEENVFMQVIGESASRKSIESDFEKCKDILSSSHFKLDFVKNFQETEKLQKILRDTSEDPKWMTVQAGGSITIIIIQIGGFAFALILLALTRNQVFSLLREFLSGLAISIGKGFVTTGNELQAWGKKWGDGINK